MKSKIFRTFVVAISLICLSAESVYSVSTQASTSDIYLIMFKPDTGLVDPPNSDNAGKVPVGEPTSGQSKDTLADTLGLNGEIIAILEVNNGIFAEITAEEAEKWRQDTRVASVQKSMEGSFGDSEAGSDYPVYRDGILTIPRVDTDQQASLFQDGVFRHDPATNTWLLEKFKVKLAVGVYFLENDGVEAIITDTLPIQVFLEISGQFSDGCQALGRVDQRLDGNRFEVVVSAISTVPDNGTVACTQALVPFQTIVSLNVFGLPAGEYEYTVNGEQNGTFTLTRDNML